MPRILRIHNRLITGGPSLNALYLTKYLSSQFETLLIVGEKEQAEGKVSVRKHGTGDLGSFTVEAFAEMVKKEIAEKVPEFSA